MDVSTAVRAYLVTNCHFDDSWFHISLAFIYFVPTVLTIIFFGLSYYTRQLFYLVMSMALAVDLFVNYLISGYTTQSPPVSTCGGPSAFPSFVAEHSFFLFVYLVLSAHFFHLKLNLKDLFWLQMWVSLSWISGIELGYSSFSQAIAGAIVGATLAFLCAGLVYAIMLYNRDYIIAHGIVTWFGYRDDIFKQPDYVLVKKEDMRNLRSTIASELQDEVVWDLLVQKFKQKNAILEKP